MYDVYARKSIKDLSNTNDVKTTDHMVINDGEGTKKVTIDIINEAFKTYMEEER